MLLILNFPHGLHSPAVITLSSSQGPIHMCCLLLLSGLPALPSFLKQRRFELHIFRCLPPQYSKGFKCEEPCSGQAFPVWIFLDESSTLDITSRPSPCPRLSRCSAALASPGPLLSPLSQVRSLLSFSCCVACFCHPFVFPFLPPAPEYVITTISFFSHSV